MEPIKTLNWYPKSAKTRQPSADIRVNKFQRKFSSCNIRPGSWLAGFRGISTADKSRGATCRYGQSEVSDVSTDPNWANAISGGRCDYILREKPGNCPGRHYTCAASPQTPLQDHISRKVMIISVRGRLVPHTLAVALCSGVGPRIRTSLYGF